MEDCIHPLPLLTAVGNGLGGGDYNGTDMGLIGSWAGDYIYIADSAPDKMTEIFPCFREKN